MKSVLLEVIIIICLQKLIHGFIEKINLLPKLGWATRSRFVYDVAASDMKLFVYADIK